MNDVIEKFNAWWQEALQDSPLKRKSAVCVSTVNADGFPETRFVDLKRATSEGFTFCSYFDSSKGHHIAQNPKVSMTAWWDHVGYQVRVVGLASRISSNEADTFWKGRSRSAQLTTTCFEQSQPLNSPSELASRLEDAQLLYVNQEIPKPDNWGGYLVAPLSIEFLTFNESRLHLREKYRVKAGQWSRQLLQP